MATKSFRDVSKFRLFTIIGFSLLTSLSLTIKDDFWLWKDILAAFLQAGIAGFAYLQCPTINKAEKETECE